MCSLSVHRHTLCHILSSVSRGYLVRYRQSGVDDLTTRVRIWYTVYRKHEIGSNTPMGFTILDFSPAAEVGVLAEVLPSVCGYLM